MASRSPLLASLALLPIGLAFAIPQTRAAESYDSCTGFITSVPATITTQGVWCMDRDLATAITNGAAITVQTNNVTIDCNHFKLGGLGAGPGSGATGINASNRLNMSVRNCNIRGFQKGVFATGAGHLVEDSRFDLNLQSSIELVADGSVIRRNQVRNTGVGFNSAVIVGIYAEGSVDVVDNEVVGVTGAATNTSVRGIWVYGGTGARVARNTVRDLMPTGTGNAQGIYTSNGSKVFIDDNRVVLESPLAGSVGFRCNALGGSLRGNTAWGFSSLTTSCLDDGGNVQR